LNITFFPHAKDMTAHEAEPWGTKTVTQLAAGVGTSVTTVRRWLRRYHWGLWIGSVVESDLQGPA